MIAGALAVFVRQKRLVVVGALIVGSLVMSFRITSLQSSEIHHSIGRQVTLEFTAVTDPKVIKRGKISLIAKAKGVPVRVIGYGEDLLPSAKFVATGNLFESKEPRVAAMFITWQQIGRAHV